MGAGGAEEGTSAFYGPIEPHEAHAMPKRRLIRGYDNATGLGLKLLNQVKTVDRRIRHKNWPRAGWAGTLKLRKYRAQI